MNRFKFFIRPSKVKIRNNKKTKLLNIMSIVHCLSSNLYIFVKFFVFLFWLSFFDKKVKNTETESLFEVSRGGGRPFPLNSYWTRMLKYKSLSSPDMIKIHKTMKSGKMSDWQVGEYNYIYRIYSLKVIQTYRIHPTNKKEKSLIFHSLSRAYTEINLGGGVKYFFAPSSRSS